MAEPQSTSFVISKAWLRQCSVRGGGWNRRQLAVIGISWPPPRKWAKNICGREITLDQKRAFEDLKGSGTTLTTVLVDALDAAARRPIPIPVVTKNQRGFRLHPAQVKAARKRLGVASDASHRVIFQAAANWIGVRWDGSKVHGHLVTKQFLEKVVPEAVYTTRAKPVPTLTVPAGHLIDVRSREWLETYEWRALRMRVLKARGARCECCGATAKDGVRIHVDHVKPRRHYPELAREESNLQVLCEVCNHGKGNWDETDWRESRVV